MAKYINLDTLTFQLWECFETEKLFNYPYFEHHDREGLDFFIRSIVDYSDKELYPFFREMDEKPAYFDGKSIITHPQLGRAIKMGGDMGIISSTIKLEDGGLQFPLIFYSSIKTIMEAANNSIPGYLGLTMGALELILEFGSEKLKEKYNEPMSSGKFCGTMCLTEPQAGSSLSDIITTAYPQSDGTYKVKGQKIFISGGDHEHVENFVHLVLARIDGAPAGTKGISLFAIPKIKEDGTSNDVITVGDFQKLGQRGYCTTHLMFGENDNCTAEIVGEQNKGLSYMFKMMNAARIAVGRGAAAIALAGYEYSLEYARIRKQGRPLDASGNKNLDSEQVEIINHPDVRRMLFKQKAIAEGSLALVLQASYYHDMLQASENYEDKVKYNLLLEILTPVAKTYPAEKGIDSVSHGLQILGGYGFCSEYLMQQYLRDIRIFSLYEGTTGIQSLDLLGRKMIMKGGNAPILLAAEMNETIIKARQTAELKAQAQQLGLKMKDIVDIMEVLKQYAQKGEFNHFLSEATLFMKYFSTVMVAWQWLKMAVKAKELIDAGDSDYSNEFLNSKIHTMKYFFHYELSEIEGIKQILTSDKRLTLNLNHKEIF